MMSQVFGFFSKDSSDFVEINLLIVSPFCTVLFCRTMYKLIFQEGSERPKPTSISFEGW